MNHPITFNSTAITRSQYPAAGPATVKAPLTPNRPRPVAGNDAYAAFAHRILTAYARSIAADVKRPRPSRSRSPAPAIYPFPPR